jgi:hypothetical protein
MNSDDFILFRFHGFRAMKAFQLQSFINALDACCKQYASLSIFLVYLNKIFAIYLKLFMKLINQVSNHTNTSIVCF